MLFPIAAARPRSLFCLRFSQVLDETRVRARGLNSLGYFVTAESKRLPALVLSLQT